jgi:hypothetical protein
MLDGYLLGIHVGRKKKPVVIIILYRSDQLFEGPQRDLKAVEEVLACDRSLLGWPRCFTDVRDSPLLCLKQARLCNPAACCLFCEYERKQEVWKRNSQLLNWDFSLSQFNCIICTGML